MLNQKRAADLVCHVCGCLYDSTSLIHFICASIVSFFFLMEIENESGEGGRLQLCHVRFCLLLSSSLLTFGGSLISDNQLCEQQVYLCFLIIVFAAVGKYYREIGYNNKFIYSFGQRVLASETDNKIQQIHGQYGEFIAAKWCWNESKAFLGHFTFSSSF